MRKIARTQRPLFGPWLAWRELPDSVREQALDVLTTLCLEILDASQIGERSGQDPSDVQTTPPQPLPQYGATNR
jgi:hypothetical protein